MTLFEFDEEYRAAHGVFCGVDEAGRGPLAGDVYAAAVVFAPGVMLEGINDSKKLSEKQREACYEQIVQQAQAYCIASATVEEINKLNILNATFLAMRRAVEGLNLAVCAALVDGNRLPELPCPAETLIKGDGLSQSIAAASILAKVSRDRYMIETAQLYPAYQFEKHKGYGTKAHCDAVRQHGPCPIHRTLFLRKLKSQ